MTCCITVISLSASAPPGRSPSFQVSSRATTGTRPLPHCCSCTLRYARRHHGTRTRGFGIPLGSFGSPARHEARARSPWRVWTEQACWPQRGYVSGSVLALVALDHPDARLERSPPALVALSGT